MNQSHPLAPFLVPVRRWWPVIAGVIVIALLAVWITLPDHPEPPAEPAVQPTDPEVAYRATHILIRDRQSPATANLDLVVLLARQGEIVNRVIDEVGEDVDPATIESIEINTDGRLGTLSFTTTQPTPELASLVATTYAQAVADHFDARADAAVEERIDRVTDRLTAIDLRIRELQAERAELEEDSLDWRLVDSELNVLVNQYGQLQGELREISTAELGAGSTLATLQEPVPVATSVATPAPRIFEAPETPWARFSLAAALAALVGIGLVIGVDRVDTRIRTRDDAEAAFGLPVAAEIPRRSRKDLRATPLPTREDPGSETAEAFRTLRLSVYLAARWRLQRESPTSDGGAVGAAAQVSGQAVPSALLVTSATTGEGKSSVVANLAASFAESGQEVLVVDCDFRRSTVHELLDVADGHGLRELSALDAESIASLARPTALSGVSLIRAGQPGPTPPWFLADNGRLVELTRELADIVVFDSGPLLATNEASALSRQADATLVVARAGKTSREQARRATEQLTRVNALVAGIVLVGAGSSRLYSYYEPLRRSSAMTRETSRS